MAASRRLNRSLLWGIIILLAFPFLFILMLSLAGEWRYPSILPTTWSLNAWRSLLALNSDITQSLLRSTVIALTVASTATGLGFITSKSIAYHRHQRGLMMLSYFPFILSPVIYAACINYFFIIWGLSGSIPGVILGQLLIAYPYSVILFSGFWNNRMHQMELLVATLGGSAWQTYWHVLLPMAKGMLLVSFFQTYLISWFEYGLTTIIGVGKVETLTLQVYQYVLEANLFYAALSSFILIIPPALLLYVNKKYLFSRGFKRV